MSAPTLTNGLTVKEERFAQLVASGTPQTEAYRQAYGAEKWKPNAAAVEASRIAKRPHVALRIEELSQEAAEAAKLTREWVIRRLMRNAEDATMGPQPHWAASNRALELLGRTRGLWQEQQQGLQVRVDIMALQLSATSPGEAIGPQARALRVAGALVAGNEEPDDEGT